MQRERWVSYTVCANKNECSSTTDNLGIVQAIMLKFSEYHNKTWETWQYIFWNHCFTIFGPATFLRKIRKKVFLSAMSELRNGFLKNNPNTKINLFVFRMWIPLSGSKWCIFLALLFREIAVACACNRKQAAALSAAWACVKHYLTITVIIINACCYY